jgi:hypothetical protein
MPCPWHITLFGTPCPRSAVVIDQKFRKQLFAETRLLPRYTCEQYAVRGGRQILETMTTQRLLKDGVAFLAALMRIML